MKLDILPKFFQHRYILQFFPSHPKKKLEGKLSSPANICDDPNLTNAIEHDSPLEAENLEEDEI